MLGVGTDSGTCPSSPGPGPGWAPATMWMPTGMVGQDRSCQALLGEVTTLSFCRFQVWEEPYGK